MEVSLSINHASLNFRGKHGSDFFVMTCRVLYNDKLEDIFLMLNISTSHEHSKNSDMEHRQFGGSLYPPLVTSHSIRGSDHIPYRLGFLISSYKIIGLYNNGIELDSYTIIFIHKNLMPIDSSLL